ncbi:MAG: PQQ-dependent sugar dehydrogenase, partial [Planctomycetota bacterium]
TNFRFRAINGDDTDGGGGIAFVLQDSPDGSDALGIGGDDGLGAAGIINSVIVEFDTYDGPFDVNDNHISVSINGDLDNPIRTSLFSIDFNGDDDVYVWIEYNGVTEELAVYADTTNERPTTAALLTQVQLNDIVGDGMYAGFSASTGATETNSHRIRSWSMTADPPAADPPTNPIGNVSAETVVSGLTFPTSLEFSADGTRMYIAQQDGVVHVAENGEILQDAFIDISDQVNGVRDRGLLGLALHPDFENNPYVYLLFTYDPPEVFQNQSDALARPDGKGNRAGRLIRVTADVNDGYRTAVAGSEVVLLGSNSTWENFNAFANSTDDFDEPAAGINPDGTNIRDFIASDSESHTVGDLAFGPDGALYVSIGDGTSYNRVDPRTVRVQDIDNLSGKILRIDPLTGVGLSDNPFFNGDADANRSKVYQLGLRNPFRISIDQVTGQLYIGDVGWTRWEEVNAAGPGANFGWPYYEGGSGQSLRTGGYENLPEAQAFYASGQVATPALFALSHGSTGINAIIVGDVYRGSLYDPSYVGDVFFNDLGQSIVRNANLDEDGEFIDYDTFQNGGPVIVNLTQGPDGAMYYVDIGGGTVGRWLFT